MYITAAEYASLTGRDASEATTIRIKLACKLLDNRIGNYAINSDGYKIRSDWTVWYTYQSREFSSPYAGPYITLHQSKIDAVQLWVATMISYLYDNDDLPPNKSENLKLGRFSVGKTNLNNSAIPNELIYVDSILVDSGIINLKVGTA